MKSILLALAGLLVASAVFIGDVAASFSADAARHAPPAASAPR